MLDFKPPKENRLVIGSIKSLLPLLMRLTTKVSHVDIDSESLDRAEIDRWLPNHSGAEPPLPCRPPCNVRSVNALRRTIPVHVRTRDL